MFRRKRSRCFMCAFLLLVFGSLVLLLFFGGGGVGTGSGDLLRWDRFPTWAHFLGIYPRHVFYEGSPTGYLVRTSGCSIPDADPFDQSVLPFFSPKDEPLDCGGPKQPLVAVDHENLTLRINTVAAVQHYGEHPEGLRCLLRAIRRAPVENRVTSGWDDRVEARDDGRTLPVDGSPVHIWDEFVHVQCRNRWEREVYSEYVAFVQVKQEVEEQVTKAKRSWGRNGRRRVDIGAVLVGIDSVSRLNFIRHLPLTHRFLVRELRAIPLLGYTKVGSNTFPNVVPMLTGRHARDLWNESAAATTTTATPSADAPKTMDDLPLAWKDFSRAGIRTFYAEDIPSISAFNYLKAGFRNPPTNYYYRPFTLATEGSSMRARSSPHCFNGRMELDVLLGHLSDFLQRFHNEPTFSLSFASRLTHDDLNLAGWADRPYLDFLKGIQEKGLLRNNLMFFFSDHGIRFGAIRDTYIGKLEERLPFAFVVLPDALLQHHGKWADAMKAALETNGRRLTTPFDVHATLMDLLAGLPAEAPMPRTGSPGRSLLRPMPDGRTCEDAAIDPLWCACQESEAMDTGAEEVVASAKLLVSHMNEVLQSNTREPRPCAPLVLKEVVEARQRTLNGHVLHSSSSASSSSSSKGDPPPLPAEGVTYDYIVTLRVEPSGGTFEGNVRHVHASSDYRVVDDVVRVDRYNNQSYCVHTVALKQLCFCLPQG